VVALRWFSAAEIDEVRRTREAVARDFDAMFGAVEDGGYGWIDTAWLAVKDQSSARFRACVLGEEENACVGALGGRAVAKPGGEGDAEGEFRRN